MGQYLGKPAYWHGNLLGAVQYRTDLSCGSTYVWDDRGPSAFKFKDAEWKKGTALRNELKNFLDGAMEKAEGVVEQVRVNCTNYCGGCPNPAFVTPELVEEFNKVCEENKNKKLFDMGLRCRAIYLRVRVTRGGPQSGQGGPIPTLMVLVEKNGDYVRFTPSEPVSRCTVM